MPRWFFLDDGPMSGAMNMSRDEYLFKRVRDSRDQIILRACSFDPPCISIGFHQEPEKVLDSEAVSESGVDLVRRITGGRALLHQQEFTYCIAASSESGVFANRLGESFRQVADLLIDALSTLGVEASLSGGRRGDPRDGSTSPCLASVSRYEITAGGRKIVGSAQRRWGSVFLQHGSILLGGGARRIGDFLPGDWTGLDRRITSVSEQAGFYPEYEILRDALKGSFERRVGAEFSELVLSKSERDEIDCAAAGKSVIIE